MIERGGEPSLVTTTLEALSFLLALKLFLGDVLQDDRTKVMVAPPGQVTRETGLHSTSSRSEDVQGVQSRRSIPLTANR